MKTQTQLIDIEDLCRLARCSETAFILNSARLLAALSDMPVKISLF
jgi:hypothetical protein